MLTSVASAVRLYREQQARDPEDELIRTLAEIHAATQPRADPLKGEVDEQAAARRVQKMVRQRSLGEEDMNRLPDPARYVRKQRPATPGPADKRRLMVTCNIEPMGPPLPPVRTVRWGGGQRKRRLELPPEPDTQFEIEMMATEPVADRRGAT